MLGVSKDASDAEIKRAFRKKARQFHPDRNPGDAGAEAKFKQVQAAHEKIGDAEARREYDQQQQMANMFGGGRGGNPFGGMGGGFEDVLGQMFSGRGGGRGSNPFGGMGGRQRQPSQRPSRPKGSDIKVSIDISVAEAEQGGTFSFTFKRLKPNSIGTMEPKTVTMKTKLEPGVKHGTVKRMKGQGHDHPEGDSGDVLLTIRIDVNYAKQLADQAEKTRDFSPKIGPYSIGYSSGTSGSRGMHFVSEKEQAGWAGFMLSRGLDGSIFERYKIGLILRANSNTYESVGSNRIKFKFYDLMQPLGEIHSKILDDELDILMGPPSVLSYFVDINS